MPVSGDEGAGKIPYVHATPLDFDDRRVDTLWLNHLHSAGITLEDGRKIKAYPNHEDYVMLRAGSGGTLTRKGG